MKPGWSFRIGSHLNPETLKAASLLAKRQKQSCKLRYMQLFLKLLVMIYWVPPLFLRTGLISVTDISSNLLPCTLGSCYEVIKMHQPLRCVWSCMYYIVRTKCPHNVIKT